MAKDNLLTFLLTPQIKVKILLWIPRLQVTWQHPAAAGFCIAAPNTNLSACQAHSCYNDYFLRSGKSCMKAPLNCSECHKTWFCLEEIRARTTIMWFSYACSLLGWWWSELKLAFSPVQYQLPGKHFQNLLHDRHISQELKIITAWAALHLHRLTILLVYHIWALPHVQG